MGKCIKINIGEIPPKAKRGEKPKRNKRIIIKICTKEEKAKYQPAHEARAPEGPGPGRPTLLVGRPALVAPRAPL